MMAVFTCEIRSGVDHETLRSVYPLLHYPFRCETRSRCRVSVDHETLPCLDPGPGYKEMSGPSTSKKALTAIATSI
jgi:hypothetical protein